MAKLPVADFLTKRLKEYDPNFEVRKGTGFYQLFFNPMQFITQPIIDEAVEMTIAQSFLRILQQSNPDAFSEEAVDSLASNFFVERISGGQSSGVARVYYSSAVDREWPAKGTVFNGENGKTYTNPAAFLISRDVMSLQFENGSYYYDIPVQSDDLGEDTLLDAGGLVGIGNDPDVITVTNLAPFTGGYSRETNTLLIERVRKSIAVRDLVTGKGFNATMFENFGGFLTELRAIGFGDAEMMRDIVYNTHIGGKIDGYFKTSAVNQGFKNIVGLLPDTTRQAYGSTNVQLFNAEAATTPDGNFDLSNGKSPIVQQVKPSTSAKYTSPVDFSSTTDLSVNDRIKITIDGIAHDDLSLKGSNPTTTTKAEILNHINARFGYMIAFSVGPYIELRSNKKGQTSSIVISHPSTAGAGPGYAGSALTNVFGLPSPAAFYGDGPITFTEITHYTVNPTYGTITRVIGPAVVPTASPPFDKNSTGVAGYRYQFALYSLGAGANATVGAEYSNNGETFTVRSTIVYGSSLSCFGTGAPATSGTLTLVSGTGDATITFTAAIRVEENIFTDPSMLDPMTGVFHDVAINDIVTFNPASTNVDDLHGDPLTLKKDYRVLQVVDEHTLILDDNVPYNKSDIVYWIQRTGIKNRETVYVQYWFSPLSVDIGPLVLLDTEGNRGIRTGREDVTITDVSFLKINKIEIIDPITYEPTGDILVTGGGYGEGGYGEGPYGIGSGSDYYMVVNSPNERFSAFEDSYIVLHPSFVGLSFRIDYDYSPECITMHNFVRSENERVLDGDILMKHFLPAYVGGTIQYKIDITDSSVPDNDTLTASLKNYINTQAAGSDLQISEVYQFLARTTDPYDRYGTYIKPFTLTAMIHNTDGSTTVVSSGDTLVVPTPSPFPKDTTKPLSPRISHWIADNIVLERM
jgi:hypothetical protein